MTGLCLPVSVAADGAVRRHWTGAAGQHRPCVCAEDGQPRCSRLLLPPQDTGSKPPRITLSVPLHSGETSSILVFYQPVIWALTPSYCRPNSSSSSSTFMFSFVFLSVIPHTLSSLHHLLCLVFCRTHCLSHSLSALSLM